MNINDLLSADRTICLPEASSKKMALETLSDCLADHMKLKTRAEIFDALIARERLGSTGLGNGVAIPHSRMPGLGTALAAVLKLSHGVDYDSPDNKPVDFMFALLVPEEATDEHLQLLAQLAELFSDQDYMLAVRKETDNQSLYTSLNQQLASRAA